MEHVCNGSELPDIGTPNSSIRIFFLIQVACRQIQLKINLIYIYMYFTFMVHKT